jgi:archaemetzincin
MLINQRFLFLIILFVFMTSCKQPKRIFVKPEAKRVFCRTINVIVYEDFPNDRANYFVSELKKRLPRVEIVRRQEHLPGSAWYKPRARYLAIKILDDMKTFTPYSVISLGLTNKDISQMRGKYNWGIMGLSYCPGRTVVISTYRLNKKYINEQGVKLCIHELGHAEGLPHCKVNYCYMRAAEGKNHFNELTQFCDSCKNHLLKKGWIL